MHTQCHACAETRGLLVAAALSVLSLFVLPIPPMLQTAIGFGIALLLVFMLIPYLRGIRLPQFARKH